MIIKGKYNQAKVFSDNVDETSVVQIEELLNQEFVSGAQIRIMPDVHAGAGCVIGFTADLGDKIVPNLVGVDIGCGIITVELGQRKINLKDFDRVVHAMIPTAFNVRKRSLESFPGFKDLYMGGALKNVDRLEKSLGTLGGGNHFVEIGVDEEDRQYLLIHTGSRNFGHQVATYYQKRAIRECSDEVPRDLKYLVGESAQEYLHDMAIAQDYATRNRQLIAQEIVKSYFGEPLENFVHWETVHNYIDHDSNLVRKGAISARAGEKVLIPLNMRDGSLIAIGKGNEDWNESAPHGAGRVLSRTQARGSLDMKEFRDTMEGIYSTSIRRSTLDEAPMAYKPMEEIVEAIGDTVEIIHHIRPIYNFKA